LRKHIDTQDTEKEESRSGWTKKEKRKKSGGWGRREKVENLVCLSRTEGKNTRLARKQKRGRILPGRQLERGSTKANSWKKRNKAQKVPHNRILVIAEAFSLYMSGEYQLELP